MASVLLRPLLCWAELSPLFSQLSGPLQPPTGPREEGPLPHAPPAPLTLNISPAAEKTAPLLTSKFSIGVRSKDVSYHWYETLETLLLIGSWNVGVSDHSTFILEFRFDEHYQNSCLLLVLWQQIWSILISRWRCQVGMKWKFTNIILLMILWMIRSCICKFWPCNF